MRAIGNNTTRLGWLVVIALLLVGAAPAAAAVKKPTVKKKVVAAQATKHPVVNVKGKAPARLSRARRRYLLRQRWEESHWLVPTLVQNNGVADMIGGDDLAVRQAALDALGMRNGTVVVADPQTGRVLTVVNQNLAFGQGFQPCSTIKLVVGLGALAEGVVTRETPVKVSRRVSLNMTEALAASNNPYFAALGNRLGFAKVRAYASLFGLGERATLNVTREQPGRLTATSPANGGVGMMSSFGEGIQLTAMQLTAVMSAIANGGTLYHLQYPETPFEAATIEPRIKRQLTISQWIPELKPGMMGAVEFGTARRASYSADEPILGKTGTCTDRATPTHLGWFGSFNDVAAHKLVVVVLLTGGAHVSGSEASAVAGNVYERLSASRYFAVLPMAPVAPASPLSFVLPRGFASMLSPHGE